MNIGGLIKTTLLDYPGQVACTVFLRGCNLNCPWCHNRVLLQENKSSPEAISVPEFFDFLDKRKGTLDGVCVSGGEATLQKDLIDLLRTIKQKGYKIKLDTNGTNPGMLQEILAHNLVDYIAMDVKAHMNNWKEVTGGADLALFKNTLDSIDLIKKSGIPHEFRTTVIRNYHSLEDLKEIGNLIGAGQTWYLQKFENPGFLGCLDYYTPAEMYDFQQILKRRGHFAWVRGC